ncbi:hypothetical protein [Bradyrhizobium sp. USDA 4350]
MTDPIADLAELVAQTIYDGKLCQPARAGDPWGGEPSATKIFCRVTARDVLAVIDRVSRVDSSLARRLSDSIATNAQLRAENDRLRAAPHAALREALESIRVYANDTLSGRADGPDDREWQRAAVIELRNRARAALQQPVPEVMEALKDANDYHDHHPIDGPRRSGQRKGPMHFLVIHPEKAATACGITIAAYYPNSSEALPNSEGGKISASNTFGEVTCSACRARTSIRSPGANDADAALDPNG